MPGDDLGIRVYDLVGSHDQAVQQAVQCPLVDFVLFVCRMQRKGQRIVVPVAGARNAFDERDSRDRRNKLGDAGDEQTDDIGAPRGSVRAAMFGW